MWPAKWTPTDKMLPGQDGSPEEDDLLDVITAGGDERELRYHNGLWWLPDNSMYVYFTPVFWKRKDPS